MDGRFHRGQFFEFRGFELDLRQRDRVAAPKDFAGAPKRRFHNGACFELGGLALLLRGHPCRPLARRLARSRRRPLAPLDLLEKIINTASRANIAAVWVDGTQVV